MTNKKIVNVASVPQRSPFRYPGGKTWLVPALRQWLRSLPNKPAIFIEPFTGGGIISLTVAFENLSEKILMVELDDAVAAVWKTILSDDARWLAGKVAEFDISAAAAQAELAKVPSNVQEKAFQTILKNRVFYGGILAPGSTYVKFGENDKGIKSRWYPQTLKKRILNIADVRDRIQFREGDGLQAIREHMAKPDAAFFIDPPYTAAGKKAGSRLYVHNELDHAELFRIAESLAGDFLMTYDNAEGVLRLAKQHGFDTEAIPMKNTHHAKMTELLIGKNLNWVREAKTKAVEQPLLFE